MQIERYRAVVAELRRASPFPASVKCFAVFRKSGAGWFDENDIPCATPQTLASLEKTLTLGHNWRQRRSSETYFPMPEFNAVLVATSQSPPRKTTQDLCQSRIRDCISHANDAFDATHDAMTGVLNARAIDEAITDAISAAITTGRVRQDSSAAVASPSQIAVMALDVDHFKQLNDSYGHDYGDIVLKCFANRIVSHLATLNSKFKATKLQFGRSGGEEFVILLSGSLNPEAIEEVADGLLHGVSDEVMPTEAEWQNYAQHVAADSPQLPHASERKVTMSVGVSSVVSPVSGTEVRAVAAALRREADAALYRAKSGGRNTTRFFPDIRNSHGTVLAHHEDTRVVVTDIGTNVGVQAGHEFLVYHPDFTGDKPFIQSDGRSRKRLGTYPRHSSGRIVVFDAQKEISFCTVEQSQDDNYFPIGSHLEFIPVGSITHLIAQGPSVYGLNVSRLSTPDELKAAVARDSESNNKPMIVAFSLLNSEEVAARRGIAFTNRALAALFRLIEATFAAPAPISQTGATMLAVVISATKQPMSQIELVRQIVTDTTRQSAGIAKFGAGVFYDRKITTPGDKSKFNNKYALDFARYAASPQVLTSDNPVEVFSPDTGNKFISKLRSLGRYAEGISDYRRLKDAGVEYAYLENQGALCYLEGNPSDPATALVAIERARELEPNVAIFLANHAIIEFARDNRVRAWNLFCQIPSAFKDFVLPDVYHPSRALAAFAAYENDPTTITKSEALAILTAAADKPHPAQVPLKPNEITDCIRKLQS